MSIKIENGNCLELMKKLPDKSIDFICCDLPYGATKAYWDKEIPLKELWEQYNRIISEHGTIALFASGKFLARLISSNVKQYKYKYTWIKNNKSLFLHAQNRPLSQHEDILIFSNASIGHITHKNLIRMNYNPQGIREINKTRIKGKNGGIFKQSPNTKLAKPGDQYLQKFTNYPSDVLNYRTPYNVDRYHSTQKPVELLEFLIKTYTEKGGAVLDNCMGSGSTGIACLNSERNFIGYELDKRYFEIAQNRLQEHQKKMMDQEK